MQFISLGDNMHEMSNPFFWKKKKKKKDKYKEAHGPQFAYPSKTVIAYLQIHATFFQYCHSN